MIFDPAGRPWCCSSLLGFHFIHLLSLVYLLNIWKLLEISTLVHTTSDERNQITCCPFQLFLIKTFLSPTFKHFISWHISFHGWVYTGLAFPVCKSETSNMLIIKYSKFCSDVYIFIFKLFRNQISWNYCIFVNTSTFFNDVIDVRNDHMCVPLEIIWWNETNRLLLKDDQSYTSWD